MRDFLDIDELDSNTLGSLLGLAKKLKKDRKNLDYKPLEGKKIALIFEKPSTRTRVSFEAGMKELGGDVIVLNSGEIQLGRGETIHDTAKVLSRYVDIIMLRCHSHERLIELAESADVPVINGLSDYSHPCQIMADLLTFEEHKGSLKNKIIVWVGDCNNVTTSWIHAASKFDFEFRIAAPKTMQPSKDIIDWAKNNGANIKLFIDPAQALKGADCVITDTWLSMGQAETLGKAGVKKKIAALKKYQVNSKTMKLAKKDAIFMHCLPAHRGEEVTDEVMDGKQSVVWDEAENRLHAQKAVMLWCLGKAGFASESEQPKAARRVVM